MLFNQKQSWGEGGCLSPEGSGPSFPLWGWVLGTCDPWLEKAPAFPGSEQKARLGSGACRGWAESGDKRLLEQKAQSRPKAVEAQLHQLPAPVGNCQLSACRLPLVQTGAIPLTALAVVKERGVRLAKR